jgi:hypothetical protein
VENMQQFWLEFSPLLKVFGCVLTLTVAVLHINKYLDIEAVTALAKLRSMLWNDKILPIHHKLENINDKCPNDTKEKEHCNKCEITEDENLYHYIGTIELGSIMVKRGAIGLKEFYNQFGYRIENLLKCKKIKEHIQENRVYYEDFIYIIERLKNEKLLKNNEL